MQRKIFTYLILGGLIGLGWISKSAAQTITIGTISPAKYCAPATISVPFTVSGTAFGANNVFSVLLSDAAGDFANPRTLAPTGKSSPLTVELPANLPNGTGYKVRILSSAPQVNSGLSNEFTINQKPAKPTADPVLPYCVGATAKALFASGGDIKWYRNATGGAPLSSLTPSTASAGTTNYYVTQSLSGCESDRLEVPVVVNETPKTPKDEALSLCQGTTAVPLKSQQATNPRWYTTAKGGSPIAAPTPLTGTATTISYYFSETSGSCESVERGEFKVTIDPKPATPIPPKTEFTYCYGATTEALSVEGLTAPRWYDDKNNFLGTTPPKPSNTVSTKYQVTQTEKSCESAKSAVISVNITRTVAPTVASSSVSYCVGETAGVLKANGDEVKWYTTETGGTPLAATYTPPTTASANTTFYASQTKNGCESDRRTPFRVIVNKLPDAPSTTDLVYCQNAAAAPLRTNNGNNLKWYADETGGNSIAVPTPSTATVGFKDYYVSQTELGCESKTRARLRVTINPTPLAPTVAESLVKYCQDAAGITALEATIATGNTVKWYLPGNGGIATTAPTPPASVARTLKYQVTQTTTTNGLGCESPKSDIGVVINPLPGSPDLTVSPLCQTKTDVAYKLTAKTAGIGTGLLWYTEASGGTGSGNAPTISLANSSNVVYYVSQTANGCEGERVKGTLTINPLPDKPAVPDPLAYCQSTVASSLSATAATGGTLKWYGTSATGGNSSGNAPVPSTANDGETSYYVSQLVKGCEGDRAPIKVTVRATPLPGVDALKEYCQNAGAQPLTASGDNLRWYNAASGGTVSTSAPIPLTTQVNTTSFYVSQTKAYTIDDNKLNCESPRAQINVQINPLPGLPSVTPFAAFCQERQDKTISFTGTGDNLKWYNASSGGEGSTNRPSLNLKDVQEKSYFVSQTTGKGCEGSRSETKIRVKRLPDLPGVTPLIEYCQFTNSNQLAATAEANAALNWYGTNATGGNRTGDAPTPSTANGGETNFYVSQTLEGCEGDRSAIRIKINTTDRPGVTTPLEYCQNVTAQPLSAQGRDLKWYRETTAAESQTTPFTPFTANVGNYSFFVTQTGTNGCESPKQEIKVRIKPLPSATITGDNSISLGASADIAVAFTGDGPWDYALSNGLTGKGETQNPLKITVSPERTTTYTVTEVANVCGKGIPNGSAIVTVRIPTVSTGNPTVASLCAGKSFTLPFQQSGDFVQGNKFNVQISLTEADAGFRSIPTVTTGSDAVATIPDSAAGGNYFVRVVGESPQFVIKGSTSPVQVTVSPKPTATLAGATTILIGETAAVNVAFTGGSPWTFNFNDGRRDTLITTSVTPYVINVKPDTTTTYKLTSVANACGEGRVSGTARIQVDPILGTEPIVKAAWLKAYPSPVQTICVVEIETPPAGEAATIQVVDGRGRIISTQQTRIDRAEVDFTNRAAGVYFLKVENGGRTGVRRILKVE